MSRTRTERLVNLVICLLSTRRFLTAAQIAATVPGYEHDPTDAREHEAFQRKFERDKAELRELGVPLETGTTSAFDTEPGYRIARREYALPDIPLQPDEAAAVGIAARLWQHAGLAAAATSGLAKLRAAGIDVDPHATLGVEPVVTVDPAFAPLTTAARERRTVTFDYRIPEGDGPTSRRLQPWGVVCWRGRWYVAGHDLDRGATRCFRLSRIVGPVKTTGGPSAFSPPQDVDLINQVARWSGPVEHTGCATVLARRGRAVGLRRWARQATTAAGATGPAGTAGAESGASGTAADGGNAAADGGDRAGTAGVEKRPADPAGSGDDRLLLPYADPESLAATLVRYGADVQVLDPPEVREAVIQRLKEIAARHEPVTAALGVTRAHNAGVPA